MNSSGGPWVSYNYRNSNLINEFKFPFMELQYDEYKSKNSNHPVNKRLKKQKQRVLNSTLRRVLVQKSQLDKERLYFHYAKGFSLDELASQFQDDLPEFMEFYTLARDTIDEAKFDSWYKRKSARRGVRIFRELERSRPVSADAYHQQGNSAARKEEEFKIPRKKRERTRSAPTPRVKGRVPGDMVSGSTQDEKLFQHELDIQYKSGCPYCPVECRPISSSSWDQRSSTGLLATTGPSHYQYFHYKKYFLYQRPMSAIGMRMEYLDQTGRRDSVPKIPHFSHLARACPLHERDGRSSSPRSRSPRSPTTTTTTEPTRPREAWMDSEVKTDDSEQSEGLDKTEGNHILVGAEIPPPPSEDFDARAELDQDSLFNDEVRQHAEESYALATDKESTGEDEGRFVPIRMPSPASSKSTEGDQLPPVKPAFHRSVPSGSTDMLSGRVFAPEISVSDYAEEEEDHVPTIVVEIVPPEPLPVKRVPEPKVQVVDVVPPREKLEEIEEPDEESSDKLYDDAALLTDRTGTVSEGDSMLDDLTAGSADKTPSILKSSSDEKLGKKTSKVSFEIVEQDEPVLKAPSLTESMIVTVISKADQKEIKKIIPKVILEDESEAQTRPTASETLLPSGDDASSLMGTSAVSTVPDSESQKSERLDRLLNPNLYTDPDDEYLRKLLAPPELGNFVPPVFDPAAEKGKKKKKKKLGGAKKGKKKKIKTRKKTEEKPPPPEEPLFTYIRRSERPVHVPPEPTDEMREEAAELQRVVATVKQFDDSYKEKMRTQPWLYGRMALSKQICRFWLPVDLRQLENISPTRYITDYCIVCKRRQKLYGQTFDRQIQKRKISSKPSRSNILSVQEAESALHGVHGDVVNQQELADVFKMMCINADEELSENDPMYVSKLDKPTFINLCALTERIFYDKFVTEDAEDGENSRQNRLEKADFEGLEWKLKDVHVSSALKRFLLSL